MYFVFLLCIFIATYYSKLNTDRSVNTNRAVTDTRYIQNTKIKFACNAFSIRSQTRPCIDEKEKVINKTLCGKFNWKIYGVFLLFAHGKLFVAIPGRVTAWSEFIAICHPRLSVFTCHEFLQFSEVPFYFKLYV